MNQATCEKCGLAIRPIDHPVIGPAYETIEGHEAHCGSNPIGAIETHKPTKEETSPTAPSRSETPK